MEIVDKNEKISQLSQTGYNVEISSYISEAFDIFKKNPGGFIAYFLVVLVISLALAFIPIVGSMISIVLSPALNIGFALVARKIKFGEAHTFNDFFGGFNKFGELFLSYLLMLVMVVLGLLLFVLPGIYLAVAYLFVQYITYFFHDGSYWDNLERSRKLVSKEWISFFGLVLLLGLLNVAGLLCLGLGILVTAPVTGIAMYLAFERIVGTQEEAMFDFEKQ